MVEIDEYFAFLLAGIILRLVVGLVWSCLVKINKEWMEAFEYATLKWIANLFFGPSRCVFNFEPIANPETNDLYLGGRRVPREIHARLGQVGILFMLFPVTVYVILFVSVIRIGLDVSLSEVATYCFGALYEKYTVADLVTWYGAIQIHCNVISRASVWLYTKIPKTRLCGMDTHSLTAYFVFYVILFARIYLNLNIENENIKNSLFISTLLIDIPWNKMAVNDH